MIASVSLRASVSVPVKAWIESCGQGRPAHIDQVSTCFYDPPSSARTHEDPGFVFGVVSKKSGVLSSVVQPELVSAIRDQKHYRVSASNR
jgi:hypothetical protein